MRILITGATGFVGKTLVPYLSGKCIMDICLLIRNNDKAKYLFGNLPLMFINNVETDWREAVINYNPDVTLHLATLFDTYCEAKNAMKIIESNITFSTLLFEAVSHTNCKHFINIGTFTEFLYGNEEYYPSNLYSASKSAFRHIIQYYQTQSKWNWINVIVYSPYGHKNEQKKVLDFLVDALISETPIKFSQGGQILDFIHVDDMVNFFYTLLNKLHLFTDKYIQLHLGTGKGYSIREIAILMERITGKKINADWGAYPYRPSDVMYAVAPIGKSLKTLNWRSKIAIEEGLKMFLDEIYG